MSPERRATRRLINRSAPHGLRCRQEAKVGSAHGVHHDKRVEELYVHRTYVVRCTYVVLCAELPEQLNRRLSCMYSPGVLGVGRGMCSSEARGMEMVHLAEA